MSILSEKNTDNGAPAMSVDGLVQQLIHMASDDKLLARMYYGWCPFL